MPDSWTLATYGTETETKTLVSKPSQSCSTSVQTLPILPPLYLSKPSQSVSTFVQTIPMQRHVATLESKPSRFCRRSTAQTVPVLCPPLSQPSRSCRRSVSKPSLSCLLGNLSKPSRSCRRSSVQTVPVAYKPPSPIFALVQALQTPATLSTSACVLTLPILSPCQPSHPNTVSTSTQTLPVLSPSQNIPSQHCLHLNPNPPSIVSTSNQTLPIMSPLQPKPSQSCLHFCSSPSQSCVRVRSNPPNHSSIVCLHFRPNPPNPVATSVRLLLSPTANVEIQFTHLIRRPKCRSCFALCFQATASFFFFFLFFLLSLEISWHGASRLM